MNFKETLGKLLYPALRPTHRELQTALEAAWQAQMAEDYSTALATLERAIALARETGDQAAEVVAVLHKSEIFMRQGRYAEAEAINQSALNNAKGQTQRSYIQTMIGMVAQAQGDNVNARAAYERALDDARAAGSEAAEGRALGRLADMYLQDKNASYAIRLLKEALPKLAVAGDNEPTSYFTGILGQAMIESGQDVEGQHLLDRALRIAEQMGYKGYARHWASVLGDRAMNEARYSDAHGYFSRWLRLFPPGTADAEYATAVTQMSRASLSLRKPDEALQYAKIALQTAETLDDGKLKQAAHGAMGTALRSLGQSADALPHLQAAAENASEQHASSVVLRHLAAAQVDSGTTDTAIQTYQQAMQAAQADDNTLERAHIHRDLGLAYMRQQNLPAAINEWTAALPLYEAQKAVSQVARIYCDIGNARRLLGQRARAMKEYEQALMLVSGLDANDLETRGLVLSSAANAYAEHGDAESADSFFTEAISLAERTGDRAAETTRCGNYGWFLLLVGRPRRAMSMLERALPISQALGMTLQAAVQFDNLGLVYDSLGDTPAALDKHRKALALLHEASADASLWAGQISVNLANTLLAMNNAEDAAPLIDAAVAQGRESGQNELLISALTVQARLHIAQRDPAAADAPLSEAIALARKIENRRLLAEALAMRSQQHAALERADEAAAAWGEAQRLYLMLHMPQGKIQPAWLALNPTR
jgi:tetratricopeptide (TPR) repeat protein